MLNLRKSHEALLDSRGAAAVEFAIIAPVMLALLFGILVYSVVLCTYSALQQVAAEAARAAISGLNSTQQAQYATQAVSSGLANYSFIDPNNVAVATTSTASTFQVSISYNVGSSFFNNFASAVMPSPVVITRSATVQLGGF